jgi:hypothetical protein
MEVITCSTITCPECGFQKEEEMPSDPDGEPLLLPMTAALQILLHVLVGFMPLLMMKRGLWSSHQQSECEKTAFFISVASAATAQSLQAQLP